MPPHIPPGLPRGLSLQRSISSRIMHADFMPTGEEIWIEDEKEVWVLASLVEQENTMLKVRRKDTGVIVEIDLVSHLEQFIRLDLPQLITIFRCRPYNFECIYNLVDYLKTYTYPQNAQMID